MFPAFDPSGAQPAKGQRLVMECPQSATILSIITARFALSVHDLIELREAIDAHLCKRIGIPANAMPRRTLYFSSDPLDDL